MTQDAYFSLLTHTKQLLLVAFCGKTAGGRVRFQAHGRQKTDGWTDRRGSRNSYLDVESSFHILRRPCLNISRIYKLNFVKINSKAFFRLKVSNLLKSHSAVDGYEM